MVAQESYKELMRRIVWCSGGTRILRRELANDRGAAANGFALEHMLLQLKRSREQELALQQFLDELQSKSSPNYHRWISAQEFGERFGLAKSDLR